MGLTLIAILTAALLLPGIVAARSFYQASKTDEVEPSIPALSSANGIALTGLFSVGVHLIYIVGLEAVLALPLDGPLPPADPYRLFTTSTGPLAGLDTGLSVLMALAWLCLVAGLVGYLAGRAAMRWGDRSIFYGPLADIVAAGEGDSRFITAYVLTKLKHEGRVVGYRGTVANLIHGEDRMPVRIVLKDAYLFTLDLTGTAPERHEQARPIDWITIAEADWENVAFRVFEVVDDAGGEDAPA